MAWNYLPEEKESRFWLEDKTPIVVQKKQDDPVSLRISLGGIPNKEIGYYIVYRGDDMKILECLEKSLEAYKKYLEGGDKKNG